MYNGMRVTKEGAFASNLNTRIKSIFFSDKRKLLIYFFLFEQWKWHIEATVQIYLICNLG